MEIGVTEAILILVVVAIMWVYCEAINFGEPL